MHNIIIYSISTPKGGLQVFMPKYNYEQIKVVKKHKKRRKSLGFLLVCVVLGGFAFLFADVFSSVIAVGSFSFSIFESDDKIVYKPDPLYVLSLGKYPTLTEAEEVANVAGSWGASGYITQMGENYYVLGSVYSTKADCDNVRENLQLTNYNTETVELAFKKLTFNISGLSSGDKKQIKTNLEFFREIYNRVYDVSIKIDKGEITNVAGSSILNTLKSEVKIKNMDLNKLNLSYSSDLLHKFCGVLTQIEDSLDVCVNQLLENSYINRAVKYTLCEIVFLEYNLLNNL